MNRRPRLLVILAFLYCVSPLIYPIIVSLVFGTPIGTVAQETLDSNSVLRNFETFILPIALGLFTFYARRVSYFIVVIGSIYLVARNIAVFAATSPSVPTSGLVAMNLIFVFVIVYLSRKNTRAIYFDKKMRWWETDPRYIVGWDAKLGREGEKSEGVRIRNIAVGGAAVETKNSRFAPESNVSLEFDFEGTNYRVSASVVWEQSTPEGNLVGMQWNDDRKSDSVKRIRALIRSLKAKNLATTRPPDRWEDFKSWLSRPENT